MILVNPNSIHIFRSIKTMEEGMGFTYKGPGIYDNGDDFMIVVPRNDDEKDPWVEPDGWRFTIWEVHCYNGPYETSIFANQPPFITESDANKADDVEDEEDKDENFVTPKGPAKVKLKKKPEPEREGEVRAGEAIRTLADAIMYLAAEQGEDDIFEDVKAISNSTIAFDKVENR